MADKPACMVIGKDICDRLDDREIIMKSRENMDYFACLYERYEERFIQYIRRISFASDAEAGDILQDAFIKVWRNLNSYDSGLQLSSWLYRIVHNETISFCRKKKSFGKNNRVDPMRVQDDDLLVEFEDESDTDSRYRLTWQVLEKLPMKYREVLILKFIEKMSYEDISDVLKMPEGTVAVRINRAKKLFRDISEKENIAFNI